MGDGATTTARPARGYSWEPFKEGNLVAARHGANSEKLVSERAKAVLAELVEICPWLREDADGIAIDILCRSKARFDAIDEYITKILEGTARAYPWRGYPDVGPAAVPDRLWQQVSRESRTILDACGRLGLTASDRARLFADAGSAWRLTSAQGPTPLQVLGERGRRLQKLRGRE